MKFPSLSSITGAAMQSASQRKEQLYRRLISREAYIGGQLFGPISKGGRREFFCLDERTWIWHEEWLDNQGKMRSITTRYDVHPDKIIKAQDGQPYKELGKSEALNFWQAARLYVDRLARQDYSLNSLK